MVLSSATASEISAVTSELTHLVIGVQLQLPLRVPCALVQGNIQSENC
jgi:hypothetical protein